MSTILNLKGKSILDVPKSIVICYVCKREFMQNSLNQKYCGKICYRKAQSIRRKEISLLKKKGTWFVKEKKCLKCNKPFTPNKRHPHQKYCSRKCRANAADLRYFFSHHGKMRKQNKIYCKNNRDKIHDRERRTRLTQWINGRPIRVSVYKRPYPTSKRCELCGKKQKYLSYHHWGELIKNEYVFGIWVCVVCHPIIENPENSLHILTLFAKKKESIEQEVAILKNNAEKFYPRVLSSKKTA